MYTKEDVQKAWEKFERYKETAEQHEFVMIFMWDSKLTPLYNDLMKNWNDQHATIFMSGMNKLFAQLGIE